MSGGPMMSATWSASPAAGRCMAGEPFVLNGRVSKVERRFLSNAGLRADALLIHFDESTTCQIGLLGTTVKSLEQHIAQGRAHFLETAAVLNLRHDWMGNVVSTPSKCRAGCYTKPRAAMFVNQPTRLIVDECTDFPFACGAKQFNLSCGWGPDDPPLASLGIALGGDQ